MDENIFGGRIMALMGHDYGWKIRSKKDAEAFFKMEKGGKVSASDGEFYWADDQFDYYLSVKGKSREVFRRFKSDRGNIFSPYWQVLDPVETIWKTRKYINAKWFTND